jgi:predicted nucleic acid-binding protein
MILVDSSVWIDYFNGAQTWQTDALDELLDRDVIAVGDLILAEVLQGFRSPKDYETAKRLLCNLHYVPLGGKDVALEAAANFRTLRAKGVTVRKTVDVFIATACIKNGWTLLHNDRDFEPFEKWLGLSCV